MIADLDTLLVALYVELTDRIIPSLRPHRAGPGRPPALTDTELVCLAVAQVLVRYHDEHHWLRDAPVRVGHLFPRLLSQSAYNRRLRRVADLMEAALRWLADGRTGETTEDEGGQSAVAHRSRLRPDGWSSRTSVTGRSRGRGRRRAFGAGRTRRVTGPDQPSRRAR